MSILDYMVGGSCKACGVAYKTTAAELAVMNADGQTNNVDRVKAPVLAAAVGNDKGLSFG
ncbi:MAG: hypothetical protein AABY33_01810 [Pseudomonadota bacterium]